jgi:hypothetical protein
MPGNPKRTATAQENRRGTSCIRLRRSRAGAPGPMDLAAMSRNGVGAAYLIGNKNEASANLPDQFDKHKCKPLDVSLPLKSVAIDFAADSPGFTRPLSVPRTGSSISDRGARSGNRKIVLLPVLTGHSTENGCLEVREAETTVARCRSSSSAPL